MTRRPLAVDEKYLTKYPQLLDRGLARCLLSPRPDIGWVDDFIEEATAYKASPQFIPFIILETTR